MEKLEQFLLQFLDELERITYSADGVQKIVDTRLDILNQLQGSDIEINKNLHLSFEKFERLLIESPRSGDKHYFDEGKINLRIDISSLLAEISVKQH